MGMEIRYAVGDGLLLGAGDLWVLMSDPGDDGVVEDVWAVVSGARPGDAPATERVLAITEKAFDEGFLALAMVDLSPGAAMSVSRGRGHVRISGADRILSLDGGEGSPPQSGLRRLVGGVVGASHVSLRPIAHRVAPPAERATIPPPPPDGVLIDGIPDAILAATGPDGPPPRPRRRQGADTDPDTGSRTDTTEPDPAFTARISQGAHTTIQPALTTTPSTPAGSSADDDGSTVHRPGPRAHLRQSPPQMVLARSCPDGHLTPADRATCRTCRQPVAPQEPREVPRPPLGGLRLPTGEVVPLDRGVVLGRKPAPLENSNDWPHLVHLPADHTFVSRMHLHIELSGWDVLARDLDSRGGTMLTMPGRPPERMRSGEAYVLEPGAVLDLAEVYEVRFEVGTVVGR